MTGIISNRWLMRLAMFAILISGCRAISLVREIQPSTAPDISRLMLKSGNIVVFNADLGWYNKNAGTIEGVTADSQHVEYHLSDITKVETVREYSIVPAVLVGAILLLAGIFLLSKILTNFEFL